MHKHKLFSYRNLSMKVNFNRKKIAIDVIDACARCAQWQHSTNGNGTAFPRMHMNSKPRTYIHHQQCIHIAYHTTITTHTELECRNQNTKLFILNSVFQKNKEKNA